MGLLWAGAGLKAAGEESPVLFFMDICRFQDSRVSEPTAEIYFSVDGSSVSHVMRQDQRYHAAVNIKWFLRRLDQEDSIIVAGDNLLLDWPQGQFPEDTSADMLRKHMFHFHYIQLPPGTYLIEATVSDQNSPGNKPAVAYKEFDMEGNNPFMVQFSDIKWVTYRRGSDNLRNRQDLLPLVTNDAYINQDSLVFYQEIYNVDSEVDGKFVIRARILQGEHILYDYETTTGRLAQKTNAYLSLMPGLDRLRSNTYHLLIELLDQRNQVFSTYRKKFYVFNSRLDQNLSSVSAFNPEADLFNDLSAEELDYYLRTLRWISTDQERQFIRVLESQEQKRNYLYNFWEKRKRFPAQKVEALWNGHIRAIHYINQQFKSNLNEGWETDRGRVFLKYGIPSDVERYPSESAAVPWEMWRYDVLGAQSNVIFIFFDPDLTTGEYPLLHSTKYGEVYNPRWQEQVSNRNSVHTPGSIDFERDPSRQRYNDKFDPNN